MSTVTLATIALIALSFLLTLIMWIEANRLRKENEELKLDLTKAFSMYASLVRQIKEKKLK